MLAFFQTILEWSLILKKSFWKKAMWESNFNPLQPGVVFLYTLKTSENHKVF